MFVGLFGEDAADRRERLRNQLVILGEEKIKRKKIEDEEKAKKEEVLQFFQFFYLLRLFIEFKNDLAVLVCLSVCLSNSKNYGWILMKLS